MKSRWNAADADAFVAASQGVAPELALRVYSSRLIGGDADLVLHGGGNTSVKGTLRTLLGDEVPCLWVKGSGSSLDKVGPKDFPALDLAYLLRLASLDALSDLEMVNQLRTHLFDASAPNPSVEALLHAFLPHRFVDHSHADAILRLSNQPDGEALVREAVGEDVLVLPYIMPGFPLAKEVHRRFRERPNARGIVLLFHGLFTFGETAEESYEAHIELVTRCEQVAAKHTRRVHTSSTTAPALDVARSLELGPVLRGAVSRALGHAVVAEHRATPEILSALSRADAATLFETGPLTPDHVIRVKPWPLVLGAGGTTAEAVDAAVTRYAERYGAYVAESRDRYPGLSVLDGAPRVILDRATGLWAFGRTRADAKIAADISEHTLAIKSDAADMSGYLALADRDLFDMEYWSLEQAKLGKSAPKALAGKVVFITGAAGAIGRGVAEACAAAGAHLFLTDVDASSLEGLVRQFGSNVASSAEMDVRDEDSVARAFVAAVRAFGGVDSVVANAGVAHVAPISELAGEDFQRVLAVNTTGVLNTLRAAGKLFAAQGLGGSIIVNSSKNVFAPGKDFGAYSASKAAAHQLGKIAAMELAPIGVRVNMINADAVFSHEGTKSGLWSEVAPSRAKSRGLTVEALEDFYRDRNLLKARVEARHVGSAVVFFASEATPTTGATLPIDGGIAEAFPR